MTIRKTIGGLRRCHLSRLLACAYGAALRLRKGGMARRILSLMLRLEGGEMHSATARLVMRRWHGLAIGAYAYGCFDPARFPHGIRIGRYASIGPAVRVFRRNHPLERLSLHPFFYNAVLGTVTADTITSRPLRIGADSWIGAAAIIVPGCGEIGEGAVIGAGAVVTCDVPALTIAAGNPATLRASRFAPDLAQRLQASRWWLRQPHELFACIDHMIAPLAADHPLLIKEQVP